MPSFSDRYTISEMIHRMFVSKKIPEVAEILDKNPNTLRNEINPHNRDFKLGLYSVIEIMDITNQFHELLSFLADRYDHHLVPNPAGFLDKKDLSRVIMETNKEANDVSTAFLNATSPESPGGSNLAPEEIDRLIKEADESIKIHQQLRARLIAMKEKRG